MAHQMGLIGITLNSKNVYDFCYYDGNSYNSTTKTWDKLSYGSSEVWGGSTSFTSSDIPWVNETDCFLLVKPGVTTPTFTASAIEENKKYPWTLNCSAVSASGNYVSYSVDYEVEFIAASWLFDYSGKAQTWVVPTASTYSFECWGASGGGSRARGTFLANEASLGGYTYGTLSLTKDDTFYVYVGQKGTDAVVGKSSAGGWNGGGLGTWDNADDETAGGGGGATDIRLAKASASDNTVWYSFDSMKSRIMVAGGGGGQNYTTTTAGYGYGGGLSGGYGCSTKTSSYTVTPGTQNSGLSYFGKGENGVGLGDSDGQAGGGGGYYGGQGGNDSRGSKISGNGGGGSSFVSGLSGCIAVEESSTSSNLILKSNSEHYSGYVFSDPKTMSGNTNESANQPVSGVHSSIKQTGQNGNGYARITVIIN